MKAIKYTALITGATGGLGSAIAHALLQHGHKVILCGREATKLQHLHSQLKKQNQAATRETIRLLQVDLNPPQGLQKLTDYIFKEDINLLIQAAGCEGFGQYHQGEPSTIKQNLHINLQVPMTLTQTIIDDFSQRQGACLAFIGSAFGSIGYPGFAPYCASKFGLRGFTEALRREYKDSAMRILYFSPRATQTQFNNDKVEALNNALGNSVDSPDTVAHLFIKALTNNQTRYQVGWPEKLFVRLNGFLPELVDQALSKQLNKIKQFF